MTAAERCRVVIERKVNGEDLAGKARVARTGAGFGRKWLTVAPEPKGQNLLSVSSGLTIFARRS